MADFPVYEAVGDELKDFDLAHRRLLLEFSERRGERDDLGVFSAQAARGRLVEPTGVVQIPAQDVLTLGSVHCLEYRPLAGASSPSFEGGLCGVQSFTTRRKLRKLARSSSGSPSSTTEAMPGRAVAWSIRPGAIQ